MAEKTDRGRREDADPFGNQADILRLSEERFRKLLKHAPVSIYEMDLPGTKFLSVNDAMCDALGYSREELLAIKPVDLLDPESRAMFAARIRKKLAGEKIDESVEYRSRRKDGAWIYTEIKVGAITFSDEPPARVVVVGHDVTERKRAEEELKSAKQQAELYLDLMGHDISNMHQIAIGQLEMAREILIEEGALDIGSREFIETPLETLNRSARIIHDVRNLQKMKSGEFKEEVLDLQDLLTEIVGEHNRRARGRPIRWAGPGPCRVRANRLLHDVFTNLIGNAVQHSGARDIEIRILLERAEGRDGPFYRISVEDNGPGIPDDLKGRIFNRFQRGPSKAEGLGLGLHLVKSLVEGFHGQVRVEDRVPGNSTMGCRFVVLLPAEGESHGR